MMPKCIMQYNSGMLGVDLSDWHTQNTAQLSKAKNGTSHW